MKGHIVQQKEMERVMSIAQEHISYAKKNPGRIRSIAFRLSISAEAALALAIADHVCQEFTLLVRNVA